MSPISAAEWRDRAACAAAVTATYDPFFQGGVRAERIAVAICRRCMVRAECLTAAVDAGHWYGVWGGATQAELRRMVISARRGCTRAPQSTAHVNAAKVRCKHGHPFDAANTYYAPDGQRRCRTCLRAAAADWARRHRRRAGGRDG